MDKKNIFEFYKTDFNIIGTVEEALKLSEELKEKKELEINLKTNVDIYKFLVVINRLILEGKKIKIKLVVE